MQSPKNYAVFEKSDVEQSYTFLSSINLLDDIPLNSWIHYCDWAYWNNPYRKDKPAGFLIKDAKKIIAFISRIYLPFRIGEWEGIAALNDYTGVAAEFRGLTGLNFISTILKDKNIAVTYSPHANKSIHLIWQKLGAKFWDLSDHTWIYRLSRIKSILLRYGLLKNCLPHFLVRVIYNIETTLNNRFNLPDVNYQIEITQKLDASLKLAITKLWETAAKKIDIGITRDFDYLYWRYSFYNKQNHYYLLMYDSNGEMIGLSVVSYEAKSGMVLIAEFLHSPAIKNSAEQLLAAIFNFSKTTLQSTTIASKIVSPSLIDVWSRSGFTKAHKTHPQYGIMTKHLDHLTDDVNVMMTYGEYKI